MVTYLPLLALIILRWNSISSPSALPTGPVQAKSLPCWNSSSGSQLIQTSFFILSYFFRISSDFCCCHCCWFACLKSFSSVVSLTPLQPRGSSLWGCCRWQSSMLLISMIQVFTQVLDALQTSMSLSLGVQRLERQETFLASSPMHSTLSNPRHSTFRCFLNWCW